MYVLTARYISILFEISLKGTYHSHMSPTDNTIIGHNYKINTHSFIIIIIMFLKG